MGLVVRQRQTMLCVVVLAALLAVTEGFGYGGLYRPVNYNPYPWSYNPWYYGGHGYHGFGHRYGHGFGHRTGHGHRGRYKRDLDSVHHDDDAVEYVVSDAYHHGRRASPTRRINVSGNFRPSTVVEYGHAEPHHDFGHHRYEHGRHRSPVRRINVSGNVRPSTVVEYGHAEPHHDFGHHGYEHGHDDGHVDLGNHGRRRAYEAVSPLDSIRGKNRPSKVFLDDSDQ